MASVLFLTKYNKPVARQCELFLRNMGAEVNACYSVDDDMARHGTVDYVVSVLYPNVLPPWILAQAKIAALNFHPGPPEYPGIGCTNFALYDGVNKYGVTCHKMSARPDAGPIIDVRRFPIIEGDNVETLTERCYFYLQTQFVDVMGGALQGRELMQNFNQQWARTAYTRKDLNALCRIMPGMSAQEMRRRIVATTYRDYPGPFVELCGIPFNISSMNPTDARLSHVSQEDAD